MFVLVILLMSIAYVLGSLSSAIIVCRLMNLPDPRTMGSGNPGTTNVMRIGGKKIAAIVLLGDALKGFIPVLIGHLIGLSNFSLGLIALAALIGHVFPVFFNFQGGKGVATFLGGIFAISLPLGIIAGLTWIVVVYISRYASLASLVSAMIATLVSPWLTHSSSFLIPMLLMLFILIYRHQENIERLRAGKESKI